jgi:hypothetical protein
MTDAAATDPPDSSGAPVLLLPVPALPAPDEAGLPQITFAFRRVGDETVAEGYTSRERLVDACGPAQPWVALPVSQSIRLLAGAGASVLVVDAASAGGAIGVDLRCVSSAARGDAP